MNYGLPPIVKLAERLMSEIEIAVTRFPRAHKHVVGKELRQDAMNVAWCAHRAWRDREHQVERIDELAEAIDRLKLRMQLGQQVKAFASFAQFEMLARLVGDLGRQCGGWQKRRSAKGQNAGAAKPRQRPSILSSHAASSQANS